MLLDACYDQCRDEDDVRLVALGCNRGNSFKPIVAALSMPTLWIPGEQSIH